MFAFKLLLIVLVVAVSVRSVNVNCATQSILQGCTSCPSSSYIALDQINQTNICTDILNCSAVNQQNCIKCDAGLVISNNTCIVGVIFCISYDLNDFCIECQPNYYLSSTNQCLVKSIPYCITYSGSSCTACSQTFMSANNNCNISSTVCVYFDYQFWKCLNCTSGMTLDSSGLFCITSTLNCVQYSYNTAASSTKCSQCAQNYFLNPTTFNCDFSTSLQYMFTLNNVQQGICINVNMGFSSLTGLCEASTNSISYCKTNLTATVCSLCFNGYYLNNGLCYSCKNAIVNCIACSNSTICTKCASTYYLLQSSSLTSTNFQCVACSTYNCDKCYSTTTQIICLSCLRGYNLYQGDCYSCGNGYRFQTSTKSCISCSTVTSNCLYCDQSKCTWCINGYVLNGSTCNSASALVKIDQNVATQLIQKAYPDHQYQIYNNQTKLLSNCQSSTNGYSCLCPTNKHVTSLCYNITGSLLALPITAFSGAITDSIFAQNSNTIRLLSQLPLFNSTAITLTVTFITSLQNFANLIQVISNVVRLNSVTVTVATAVTTLSNKNVQRTLFWNQKDQIKVSNAYSDNLISMFLSVCSGSMMNAFSLTQTTQIYGNGYYFKYNPANVFDSNTNFITTNLSTANLVYVWFDNYASSLSLTGNFYIYQPAVVSTTTQVKLKQLYFPSTTYSYVVYKNNILQSGSVSQSNGYLTFTVSTSNSSTLNQYQVRYSSVSSVIDSLYADKRIQSIFYQMSFIYILIFLVAYLFFIPFCTIVDLCDKHSQRRKRVRSQDLTVTEQRQENSSSEQKNSNSQSSVVIAVNYRDFFPIYNVANTPRPKRLLKLCLFILNLQHGVTFLTLIYFNLVANNPVIGVVLAIPVYFCTVIMGYICGALVLFLPGALKYLINLIAIGYWILWVALMPIFLDTLYYPYIYIFAVVFILIDFLVDFLQTFLVYFVVKNSERQINMFKCIATWLSYRGFYQFDKLAKQMAEA